MRSQSGTEHPRLWVMLAMAASLCVAVPAFAQSQCAITGPNYLCSGQATLCGPNGPFEYHWTGPNGFVGPDARCITVTVAGTYSLRTFDFLNGLWAGPCTHDIVGEAEAAPCLIEGSPTGCTGEPAELCGPAGEFTFNWTGPNGFADTSRCVSVTVSGTYTLAVQSPSSGCPATTCSHSITFGPCGPPQKANCPRTATFWNSQCDGGSKRRFSADERGSLASRVDEMSQYLQWSDDLRSWCRTLDWRWGMSLEDRARRQFTAVATNVAAGDMQLKLNGRSLGLTRETALSNCDDARSIGEWLSKTDARLLSLRGFSRNNSHARAAYRKIIRTAWAINHARHIGATCIEAAHKLASSEPEEILVELDGVDALVDEPMLLEAPSPNPFKGVTRITFELTQDTGEPFEIAVFDIAGRKVQSLVSGVRNAGVYELQWDGHRADGSNAPGGLYFVHGHVGNFRVQNRVVLMP